MNSISMVNPFLGSMLTWGRLAWAGVETAMGSAQVIARRTRQFALAGLFPVPHAMREVSLMGTEKVAAAAESAQSVAVRMAAMNQQFASLAIKQMLSVSAAIMSIAGSRSVGESVGRQAKLVTDTATRSVAAVSKISGSTARLARTALKPVHKRVTGNVRRLRKSSTRSK